MGWLKCPVGCLCNLIGFGGGTHGLGFDPVQAARFETQAREPSRIRGEKGTERENGSPK